MTHGGNLLILSRNQECPIVQSSSQKMLVTPIVQASFDWSDFPILQQHAHPDLLLKEAALEDSLYYKNTTTEPVFDSTWTDSSSDSSSIDDLSSVSSDVTSSHHEALSDFASSSSKTRKSVSFSESNSVRTYSRIVGDHPFCHALPLALGWDFVESQEPSSVDSPFSSRQTIPRRWNYYERRNLLRNVAGISEAELNQAESDHQHRRPSTSYSLHHVPTAKELLAVSSC